jgi:hypothetical protein
MMVLWDVRFNGDGTGVGADDGVDGVVLRGNVIVGREGRASEPGSILYGAVAASGADTVHDLFDTDGAHPTNAFLQDVATGEIVGEEDTLGRESESEVEKEGRKWWSMRMRMT